MRQRVERHNGYSETATTSDFKMPPVQCFLELHEYVVKPDSECRGQHVEKQAPYEHRESC